MGNQQQGAGGKRNQDGTGDGDKVRYLLARLINAVCLQDKKRKYEAPLPTRIGKRKKGGRGPDVATKLPLG
jgi:26S proteasome regulatory subunit T2